MKTVRIGQKTVSLIGASNSDPYFDIIRHGSGDAFDRLLATLNLDPSGIALDIGANIGITAMILSQRFSKVFAFEPGQSVYAALKANIETNHLSNVSPVNAAVSNSPGTVNFAENSAYGHISDYGAPVSATTVDDFAALNSLPRVDFMKIDVEGFEKDVLLGAENTIARFNPVIHMEYSAWTLVAHSKQNPVEFADWLLSKFGFVYLIDGNELIRITSAINLASRNMVQNNCVDDLILCNKEVSQKQAARRINVRRLFLENSIPELARAAFAWIR